jgi:hypothetical protein
MAAITRRGRLRFSFVDPNVWISNIANVST